MREHYPLANMAEILRSEGIVLIDFYLCIEAQIIGFNNACLKQFIPYLTLFLYRRLEQES